MTALSSDLMLGRRAPTSDSDSNAIAKHIELVAKHFTLKWLTSDHGNPIQKLWSRKDGFATAELATLGDALERMSVSNAEWVKRRVSAAKARKAANRIGDLFELVGLGMFQHSDQIVTASKESQPGFDGVVQLNNGAKIFMSMKNHDISSHEGHFTLRSETISQNFRIALQDANLTGLALFAFIPTYPQEADWKTFSSALSAMSPGLVRVLTQGPQTFGSWTVYASGFSGAESELATSPTSYKITICGGHHKNERANLLSNLSAAASNFETHLHLYNQPFDHRCLFIRLSGSAPTIACRDWCLSFFQDFPESPIDCIILYQMACATLNQNDGVRIIQSAEIVQNPRHRGFAGPSGETSNLKAKTLIGLPTPMHTHMQVLGTNVSIRDNYIFQRGDIYRKAIRQLDGSLTGRMRYIAPGVLEHSVVDVAGSTAIFSGLYPESDRLILFS
jgi:hypothetical protein